MRYFLDTEFIERGYEDKIQLVSIGIVAEDGRKYYAIASDGWEARPTDWVWDNVLPHLGDGRRLSRAQIAQEVFFFCNAGFPPYPEFWGYYCDYDWVLFCGLFGRMVDLPKKWPMYCNDVKQLAHMLGNPRLPKQTTEEHNALADAEDIKAKFEFLTQVDVVEAVRALRHTLGSPQP